MDVSLAIIIACWVLLCFSCIVWMQLLDHINEFNLYKADVEYRFSNLVQPMHTSPHTFSTPRTPSPSAEVSHLDLNTP
jgi:hypothetical protein